MRELIADIRRGLLAEKRSIKTCGFFGNLEERRDIDVFVVLKRDARSYTNYARLVRVVEAFQALLRKDIGRRVPMIACFPSFRTQELIKALLEKHYKRDVQLIHLLIYPSRSFLTCWEFANVGFEKALASTQPVFGKLQVSSAYSLLPFSSCLAHLVETYIIFMCSRLPSAVICRDAVDKILYAARFSAMEWLICNKGIAGKDIMSWEQLELHFKSLPEPARRNLHRLSKCRKRQGTDLGQSNTHRSFMLAFKIIDSLAAEDRRNHL